MTTDLEDAAAHIGGPWAPYCLMCSTMGRMTPTATGWKCEGRGDHFGRAGCGNEIGRDLRRANTPKDGEQ